jgi:hypothetical protein
MPSGVDVQAGDFLALSYSDALDSTLGPPVLIPIPDGSPFACPGAALAAGEVIAIISDEPTIMALEIAAKAILGTTVSLNAFVGMIVK